MKFGDLRYKGGKPYHHNDLFDGEGANTGNLLAMIYSRLGPIELKYSGTGITSSFDGKKGRIFGGKKVHCDLYHKVFPQLSSDFQYCRLSVALPCAFFSIWIFFSAS